MASRLMRAGVVVKPNEIVVREAEVSKVGKNDVLINVKYCGICGTDLHILEGAYSSEFLPLIPGHEFVGYVEEVGSEVNKFSGGEMVTADINLGCGECFYCKRNQVLMCKECKQIGIHQNGAFAEYVCVPANKVYPLPDNMPIKNGALIEPVSCVVRSARRSALSFASSVVIIGAGAIGLLHLQMAKNCGAAPIIVISRSDERLDMAKKMGADYIIKSDSDKIKAVKEITEGRGADFVIESAGSISTYKDAFELVRPGGRVVAFGLTGAGDEVALKPFDVVLKELSIESSVAGIGSDVEEAITMVKYGRFDLDCFTSVVYPIEDIAEAFDRVKKDKSIAKVLVSI